MATFKCKMCDAVLNVRSGVTIYECEYCGTKQTITLYEDDIAVLSNTDHRENVHNKENDFVSVEPLLKRAFLFLEDGDWGQAKIYCENALDNDPENGRAYLGKLMADVRVRHEADLAEIDVDYRTYNNFEKAIRFGAPQLVSDLKAYSMEAAYNLAVRLMDKAVLENDYRQAAEQFRSVEGYKDADELAGKCDWLAKETEVEAKKKQQEDMKNNKLKNIYNIALFFPIVLIFISLISAIKPTEKTVFILIISIIATVLGVYACCYLHHVIKTHKLPFWATVIFNNIMMSFTTYVACNSIRIEKKRVVYTESLWIKILITMSICSLIFGFIGNLLGKRKADEK